MEWICRVKLGNNHGKVFARETWYETAKTWAPLDSVFIFGRAVAAELNSPAAA
jgi:hypothetical protein